MIEYLSKMILKVSAKKIMLLFFALAFIIRFAYSYYYYLNTAPGDRDYTDNLYYLIALDILDQGTIFYNTDHPYKDVVGPIIPIINAATIALFGNSWFAIFIITSIASSLVVLMIYKTGLLILDKNTAFWASFWASISPQYIFFSTSPGKDIFMALFLISIIYMLLKLFCLNNFTYGQLFLFTALFAISIHCDERYIVFTPIILFSIVFSETLHLKKISFKKSLIFSALVIFLMIPWTIRNYYKFHRVVLLTTRTERLTDKLLGNPHRKNPVDNAYSEEIFYIKNSQIDSVINGTKKITDGGWEITEIQRKAMKNGNLPHTFNAMESYWSRFKAMMRPIQIGGEWERTGYYYSEKSLRHNLSSLIFYGMALFLSFPGFFYLYRRSGFAFYLFCSIIIVYILLHVFTIPYTNWRYRLPLDSLFILVGSFGLLNVRKSILMKTRQYY